jgi:hypothetical protein
VGKSEGKSLLGRPKHRWEDNFKLYFNIIEWENIKGLIWLRGGTDIGLLCV